ncbi:MAG: hypothetical protein OXH63_14775 [Gemmatimonadetes bacterium]|nr:hypothetical protein [Gemmatimonadota bacterium]
MMVADWVVFVEGSDDEHFIRCLLQHISVANVDTARIGGGVSKLPSVAPQIQRRRDAGARIAVVLDANSDFEGRRAEFLRKKDELGLPIDRFFLSPNNKDGGCLETLLEEMAIPDHRVVYDCLKKYEDCLLRNGKYQLPNPKGRIYAYCEALNIETHPSKRNYGDSKYWDLNTPTLEPLKQFLCDLHATAP